MAEYCLFGEKMNYCREKLGISKKELAEVLCISPSTLSRYEKGTSMPAVMPLYILALLTDMVMEDFIDETVSLEEFKKLSQKTLIEMYIDLHNDIMKNVKKDINIENKKDTSM